MRAVRSCISSIIIFAVGLAIGLVVLGWWLYPVQWDNGNMTTVSTDLQEDYLRAAIDSYTLNGDQNLANNRYDSLVEFGPPTLSYIQQNPGSQSPQDIQNYSVAVVGGDGSVVVPETTPVPDTAARMRRAIANPQMAAILFLGLLLVVVLIAIFFIARRGRKAEEAAKLAEVPPVEAAAVAAEDAVTEGAPVSEEAPLAEEAVVAEEVSAPEEAPAEEEAGGEGLGVAGLAAAGVAAVGVAAAVSGDEQPVEELPVAEEAAVEAAPLAEESEGGAGLGAAAVGGLAAAALIAGKGGEGEAVEEAAAVEPEGEAIEGEGGLAGVGLAAAGLAAVAAGEGEPAEEAAPVVEEAAAEWLPESELAAEEAIPPVESTVADEIAALYYKDVIYIEGVGPVYGQKLKEAGVRTPADLLTTGATRKGREDLAEKTGIPHKLILEWVNHVDLFRVKGIGSEYADLLEAAGVDTVPELAQRNAANLYQKMLEINEEKKLVRKVPVATQVESWVAQAKTLHRIVTY